MGIYSQSATGPNIQPVLDTLGEQGRGDVQAGPVEDYCLHVGNEERKPGNDLRET